MPKYGNMAKNPKTNMVQIMPLTQKDASLQYWPIYEVKSLFTRNGPRRPFFWHKISHYKLQIKRSIDLEHREDLQMGQQLAKLNFAANKV